MILISILAILVYPVNTLAITAFATWAHPKCMMKNDIGILIRCNFLFNRWKPDCYWYSTISVTRNFFMGCLPMVVPEDSLDIAVALMLFVLMVPVLIAARMFPRRTPLVNTV